jgi:hypothetical protein
MRMYRPFLLLIPFLTGAFAFAQTPATAQNETAQTSPATGSTSPADEARLSLTKEIMTQMAAGQISMVCDHFTPDLKDSLDEDKMQFVWNRLTGISGAFQRQLSQNTRTIHGSTIYVARSQFEESKVEMRLMFTDSNQVARIWLGPVSDLTSDQMEASSKELVEQLHQKQFEQLTMKFDSDLKASMPAERIAMSWTHVLSHLGEFKTIKLASKDDELDFVDVTCSFETGEIIVRVAFDPSGKVGALWMIPVEAPASDTPTI